VLETPTRRASLVATVVGVSSDALPESLNLFEVLSPQHCTLPAFSDDRQACVSARERR
jgi:hypothetical protein